MPNWEPVYPEKINWQNLPSPATPIDEINLGKGDNALREIDDRVLALGKSIDFILYATEWVNNVYTIQTNFFEDDDHPFAQVWGLNSPETYDDEQSRQYITKIICTSTEVNVYASQTPIVDLKLIMRR